MLRRWCHDISDNRFFPERRSYGGLPLCAVVDQIIPLTDFCFRNDLEIQSFDYSIRHKLNKAIHDRFFAIFAPSLQPPLISMAYLSMDRTRSWHFPTSEKELARVEDSLSQRGLAQLYSTNLDRPEYVTRNFDVSVYGQSPPRFMRKGQAIGFVPRTLSDHLASCFFDVRSHATAGSGDCSIILELDWPTKAGRLPTVVLQTTSFDTLASIESSAPATRWISPAIPVDNCPERLRVALLFPDEAEFWLPLAIRVLMRG